MGQFNHDAPIRRLRNRAVGRAGEGHGERAVLFGAFNRLHDALGTTRGRGCNHHGLMRCSGAHPGAAVVQKTLRAQRLAVHAGNSLKGHFSGTRGVVGIPVSSEVDFFHRPPFRRREGRPHLLLKRAG